MTRARPVAPGPSGAELPEGTKRLAMVCWSNDLDRMWPTLILATTAAASGMQVDVFFTFWGLRALQRPAARLVGSNWQQKLGSLLDRGGVDRLRLSKWNFGGLGAGMVRRLARKAGTADPAELLQTALELGVRLHPCQTSLDIYGLTDADFIDGVQPSLGAASFLELAAEADVTLFI